MPRCVIVTVTCQTCTNAHFFSMGLKRSCVCSFVHLKMHKCTNAQFLPFDGTPSDIENRNRLIIQVVLDLLLLAPAVNASSHKEQCLIKVLTVNREPFRLFVIYTTRSLKSDSIERFGTAWKLFNFLLAHTARVGFSPPFLRTTPCISENYLK